MIIQNENTKLRQFETTTERPNVALHCTTASLAHIKASINCDKGQ